MTLSMKRIVWKKVVRYSCYYLCPWEKYLTGSPIFLWQTGGGAEQSTTRGGSAASLKTQNQNIILQQRDVELSRTESSDWWRVCCKQNFSLERSPFQTLRLFAPWFEFCVVCCIRWDFIYFCFVDLRSGWSLLRLWFAKLRLNKVIGKLLIWMKINFSYWCFINQLSDIERSLLCYMRMHTWIFKLAGYVCPFNKDHMMKW